MQNPERYTETLVSVPGLITFGADQFVMHGYDCADGREPLQLQFGGQTLDPKDRFHVSRERLESSTVPLKKDVDYDVLQKLLQQASASGQTKMLRATLSGRFFISYPSKPKAGDYSTVKGRLVISEVDLVSDELESPVDFSPLHPLRKPAKGCSSSELPLASRADEDHLQRQSLEDEFAYLKDPREVAARAIAQAAGNSADQLVNALQGAPTALPVADFTWSAADGTTSYNVVVNRPYWLLATAVSGDSVIWVPKQMVRTSCPRPAH